MAADVGAVADGRSDGGIALFFKDKKSSDAVFFMGLLLVFFYLGLIAFLFARKFCYILHTLLSKIFCMTLTAIGIRATPKKIHYCIIKSTAEATQVIDFSSVIIPFSLILPEKLNFVRKTFRDLIAEYKCERAGIRITESMVSKPNIERVSYEAVIQELLSSSSVEKYLTGQISTITAKLGLKRVDYKLLLANEQQFELIEGFGGYGTEEKDSILVGLAALAL